MLNNWEDILLELESFKFVWGQVVNLQQNEYFQMRTGEINARIQTKDANKEFQLYE